MTRPTIILIGGQVTLNSGATVDSRQPLAGDEWDFVLREAIGTSEAWWLFAKSLVDKILSEASPDDAWALTWANKTFKRAKPDGGVTRVRIPTVLDGAEQLMHGHYTGATAQIDGDKSEARYRILPYLLRFPDLDVEEPPTVFIGSFHETYEDGTDIVGLRPLDVVFSRWPNTIVVLPHTPLIEAKARAFLSADVGRQRVSLSLAEQTHPAESKRYVAGRERLDELRRSDPYVLANDFHVTFWLDRGRVSDAAELDAALAFIRARYDLTFGLWDLARDPVLRNSLLTKGEFTLIEAKPAALPAEVKEAAHDKAAERDLAKAQERDARQAHHAAIWPTLSAAGWRAITRDVTWYTFAAGPDGQRFPGAEPEPVLYFGLHIQKRQAVLSLFEFVRSGRTEELLRTHASEIEAATGTPPQPETQTIWRLSDLGWTADPEPWSSRLPVIQHLVDLLLPHLGPLAEAAATDAKTALARQSPMVVEMQPRIPAAQERKASLWDRLRRR